MAPLQWVTSPEMGGVGCQLAQPNSTPPPRPLGKGRPSLKTRVIPSPVPILIPCTYSYPPASPPQSESCHLQSTPMAPLRWGTSPQVERGGECVCCQPAQPNIHPPPPSQITPFCPHFAPILPPFCPRFAPFSPVSPRFSVPFPFSPVFPRFSAPFPYFFRCP